MLFVTSITQRAANASAKRCEAAVRINHCRRKAVPDGCAFGALGGHNKLLMHLAELFFVRAANKLTVTYLENILG
jgi:hypothetical protein